MKYLIELVMQAEVEIENVHKPSPTLRSEHLCTQHQPNQYCHYQARVR